MESSNGFGKFVALFLIIILIFSSTIVLIELDFQNIDKTNSELKEEKSSYEQQSHSENSAPKNDLELRRETNRKPPGTSSYDDEKTIDRSRNQREKERPFGLIFKDNKPIQKENNNPVEPLHWLNEFEFDFNSQILLANKPKLSEFSIEINGSISTQTWNAAGSPYYLTGNVTVPLGNTLIIEPGVDVVFNGSYNIFVEGALYANGTVNEKINFTSNKTTASPGDWGSIQFNTTGDVSAKGRLSYCNFNFSTNAVIINSEGGIEIDNCDINYTSSYGILAGAGRFIIHNNIFNTTEYGIYVDIHQLDQGSATIGDLKIIDNNITGAKGIAINRIHFENPLNNSNISVGNTIIANNTINSTVTSGIIIQNYKVNLLKRGNISWGDVLINDNYINIESGTGINFGGALENLDNVTVHVGKLEIVNNNITTKGGKGIYQDWFTITNLKGNTSITINQTSITDNMINSTDNGLGFDFRYIPYFCYDNSTVYIEDMIFMNNTIKASGSGMYLDFHNIASNIHDNSKIILKDILITENKIESNDQGIQFFFINNMYYMYNNSFSEMADIEISWNYIESISNGASCKINSVGYKMYSNTNVTLGSFYVNHNIVNTSSNKMGLDITSFEELGTQMYGNSKFSMDDFEMCNNTIIASSGYGLYSSSRIGGIGYQLNDFSSVAFGDIFVCNNNVTSYYYGIYFSLVEGFGAYLYNHSTVQISNWYINGNTIRSNIYDGIIFDTLRGFGVYMYAFSTFKMGNFYIDHNKVWSYGVGLYFEPEYFGSYIYWNSTATIGRYEVIDNYFNSSNGIGIYSWWWWKFGSDLYENAISKIGDCRIMNNIIRTNTQHGIFTGPYNTGENVYDNSQSILGNYRISGNTVNVQSSYGIYFESYDVGSNLQPSSFINSSSEVILGNIMIYKNTVKSKNTALYFKCGGYGRNLYNYSSFRAGNIDISENYLLSDMDAIIVVNSWSIYDIYDNAIGIIGSFNIENNTIVAYTTGLWYEFDGFGFILNKGYGRMGDLNIINNNISSWNVIELYWKSLCYLHDQANVTVPGLKVIGNKINSTEKGIYYTTSNCPDYWDPGTTQIWNDVIILDNYLEGAQKGIYLYWQNTDDVIPQPKFTLVNNIIKKGSVVSTGIYMKNIYETHLDRNIVDNYDYGVYLNNSHIWSMVNSSVSNIGLDDFYLASNSSISTLNTTFRKTNVTFEDKDSLLEVAWFLNIDVKLQTGTYVPNANVTVTDVDSKPVYMGKTGAEGRCYYIPCMDYTENKSGIIKSYNDHSAAANDAGMFGSATPSPTMDRTRNITIVLIDTFRPVLLNDNSDTGATTGDPFNFKADIIDNVGIDMVHVVYWFGTGTSTNQTMDGSGPYNWTITVPSNSLDQLHYYFTAGDLVGNWLVTPRVDIDVLDNDAPKDLVDNSDTTAIFDTEFQLEASASDNIGVTEIHVVWWFDSNTPRNDTMYGIGPLNWTIDVPPTSVSNLSYYFTVSDEAGNWLVGPITKLNITDNVAPEIGILSPAGDSLVAGSINIQIKASDKNIGLAFVIVEIAALEIYNATPGTETFSFDFNTTLIPDGNHTITATVVDKDGMWSIDQITLIIDNTPPLVEAGSDIAVETGSDVQFNGSGSSDINGIASYQWIFIYKGVNQTLTGEKTNFTFYIEGDYNVTLTVSDVLGNTALDYVIVQVKKPVIIIKRPKVESTTPEDKSTNISVSTTVTITFDIPMINSSVEKVLTILPDIVYTISWNEDNTTLTIHFSENLSYTTTYTITIGDAKATTGGLLEDAPFSFSFITEKEPKIPTITITSPLPNAEYEPGETITIEGTSMDLKEGSVVTVTINGVDTNTTIGDDGSWSVQVKLPEIEGDYSITVTVDDVTQTTTVKVIKPQEPDKGAEGDTGFFGLGPTMDYIMILIIIVIVIIILFMIMRRRKPEEEEPEEEEREEEGAEEKEEEEFEEFECPECGAAIGAYDTECSECGHRFGRVEEEEEFEE